MARWDLIAGLRTLGADQDDKITDITMLMRAAQYSNVFQDILWSLEISTGVALSDRSRLGLSALRSLAR